MFFVVCGVHFGDLFTGEALFLSSKAYGRVAGMTTCKFWQNEFKFSNLLPTAAESTPNQW